MIEYTDWLPLKSCPFNTWVLCCWENEENVVMCYNSYGNRWDEWTTKPTHWRPVPKAHFTKF